jgi:Rieske 2Fe-2S family protein
VSAVSIPATLPARFYTDAELFRKEVERFFFERWFCAGRAEPLSKPGDYFLCEIGGESVIVTRDNSGSIRAFFNVCRHRGTRMCTQPEGTFTGRIRCPYHAWSYGFDGTLMNAPHMDDPGFSRADYPLHPVGADIWDGHVFLNFDKRPQPLIAQLGELPGKFTAWRMQDLRLYKRIVYDVQANWKLIVLNYNECLHCPVLHPALNKLTNYLGADNEPATSNYIGGSMGFKDGIETMTFDGVRRRQYLPDLSGDQRRMVCYYAILPNLLLSLHPDYMMTHTLWPVAVDRTRIVCEWHFHPSELAKPDFQGDDAVEFWDQTNREDWGISELSQLGISSRVYTPGPYAKREELLHAFDRIVSRQQSEAGEDQANGDR